MCCFGALAVVFLGKTIPSVTDEKESNVEISNQILKNAKDQSWAAQTEMDIIRHWVPAFASITFTLYTFLLSVFLLLCCLVA